MPVFWSLAPTDTSSNFITWDFVEVAVDPTDGDLDINVSMVRGDNAVLQRIVQRLRFFLGEWFLDTRLGVPWFQQIFAGRNPELARFILQKVVSDIPGVRAVQAFSLDWDRGTRVLALSFNAKLTTGTQLTVTSLPFVYVAGP